MCSTVDAAPQIASPLAVVQNVLDSVLPTNVLDSVLPTNVLDSVLPTDSDNSNNCTITTIKPPLNNGSPNNCSTTTVSVLSPLGHDFSQDTIDGLQNVIGGVVGLVLPLNLNQPLARADTVADVFDSAQNNKVIESMAGEFLNKDSDNTSNSTQNKENGVDSANLPLNPSLTPLSDVQTVITDIVDADIPTVVSQDSNNDQNNDESSSSVVNPVINVGNLIQTSVSDVIITSDNETNNPNGILGVSSDEIPVQDLVDGVVDPVLMESIVTPVLGEILPLDKSLDGSNLNGAQVKELLPDGVVNPVFIESIDTPVLGEILPLDKSLDGTNRNGAQVKELLPDGVVDPVLIESIVTPVLGGTLPLGKSLVGSILNGAQISELLPDTVQNVVIDQVETIVTPNNNTKEQATNECLQDNMVASANDTVIQKNATNGPPNVVGTQ